MDDNRLQRMKDFDELKRLSDEFTALKNSGNRTSSGLNKMHKIQARRIFLRKKYMREV